MSAWEEDIEKKVDAIINEKVWWREEREETLDRIEKLEKHDLLLLATAEEIDPLKKEISELKELLKELHTELGKESGLKVSFVSEQLEKLSGESPYDPEILKEAMASKSIPYIPLRESDSKPSKDFFKLMLDDLVKVIKTGVIKLEETLSEDCDTCRFEEDFILDPQSPCFQCTEPDGDMMWQPKEKPRTGKWKAVKTYRLTEKGKELLEKLKVKEVIDKEKEKSQRFLCEICWKSYIWACPLLCYFPKNIITCSAYEPTDVYLKEQELFSKFLEDLTLNHPMIGFKYTRQELIEKYERELKK